MCTEGKEAAAEAIPDKVATQVEEAGKLTEGECTCVCSMVCTMGVIPPSAGYFSQLNGSANVRMRHVILDAICSFMN